MTNTATLSEDQLRQFTGSENWCRHGINRAVLFTDGAKYLAGEMFQKILNDSLAQESIRLMGAELAGDSAVINDDLADALMAIVRDADEPEKLRTRAAILFGAVLEQTTRRSATSPILRAASCRTAPTRAPSCRATTRRSRSIPRRR